MDLFEACFVFLANPWSIFVGRVYRISSGKTCHDPWPQPDLVSTWQLARQEATTQARQGQKDGQVWPMAMAQLLALALESYELAITVGLSKIGPLHLKDTKPSLEGCWEPYIKYKENNCIRHFLCMQ